MDLTLIFGNSVRVRVLQFLFEHPEKYYNITSLAAELSVSHVRVSVAIHDLAAIGIVRCIIIGRNIVIRLNFECPITCAIRALIEENLQKC